MPNKPAIGRLEKALMLVFGLALAAEIALTVKNCKINYKLDHPKGIADYFVQPGDSFGEIYSQIGKQFPRSRWVSKVLEYNPGLKETSALKPGDKIILPFY